MGSRKTDARQWREIESGVIRWPARCALLRESIDLYGLVHPLGQKIRNCSRSLDGSVGLAWVCHIVPRCGQINLKWKSDPENTSRLYTWKKQVVCFFHPVPDSVALSAKALNLTSHQGRTSCNVPVGAAVFFGIPEYDIECDIRQLLLEAWAI